jgi:hypothetical protein
VDRDTYGKGTPDEGVGRILDSSSRVKEGPGEIRLDCEGRFFAPQREKPMRFTR